MKKFLSIIGLCFGMALFTPTKSQAIGACILEWVPNNQFIQAGGVVSVTHSDGSSYSVDKTDYVPGDYYQFDNQDTVIVTMPSCALWQWGTVVFGTCNSQGGITYGPPQAQGQGALQYYQFRVVVSCGCPTGQSSYSFQWIYGKYCQSGGGGQ